ncbi:MAG: hypothetical protein ACTHLW_02175 [Verrucomicrobiota bacterium]
MEEKTTSVNEFKVGEKVAKSDKKYLSGVILKVEGSALTVQLNSGEVTTWNAAACVAAS